MSGCKQCPAYAKCTATYRGSACDRKKLIAIIKEKDYWLPGVGTLAGQTLRLADHLIANGVTFAKDTNAPSKWIHLLDEMPQECGDTCKNVILLMDDGFVTVGWLNEITRKGYYLDTINDVVIRAPLSRFTHWMPLPEPPKEV